MYYVLRTVDPLLPNGEITYSTEDIGDFELAILNALNNGVHSIIVGILEPPKIWSINSHQDIRDFISKQVP